MAASNIIDSGPKRKRLEPCREPYWQKLSKGRFIGFRKTPTSGSWIARLNKKQHRLGAEPDFTYEQACDKAQRWFDDVSIVGLGRYTVRRAIKDYVADRRIEKGLVAAKQAEANLRKHVPEPLLEICISDLKLGDIQSWLKGLVKTSDIPEEMRKSKATANRILANLKAALNLAYKNQRVASDHAWKSVASFRNVDGSRTLFLTDEQVKRLLDVTSGSLNNLLRAAILTGARYGELRAANAGDFDADNGVLALKGKTGARSCFLSDAGISFFKEMASGKTPKAPLLLSPHGERWKPYTHSRRMEKAKRAAKLPAETVFYSLRHYHISKALLAGVNILVVAKNVGTSVKMIEKHYGKFTSTNKREMFNRVELSL